MALVYRKVLYESGSIFVGNITASNITICHTASAGLFDGTASYAQLSLSSSHASVADSALTASYATSASYEIITELSASHSDTSDTASYISASSIDGNIPTASVSISSSHSVTSDTASFVDASVISGSVSSASYVPAAGNDREVQFNSSGSFDTETNFVFTTDTALGISGTGTEPLPITGGLYFNLSDGMMKMCIDLDKLYYTTISGSGGGWLPTDLPELELWYDANQITGVLNGDTVDTFPESSGNNRIITQSVEGQKPKYYTNIQNGLPAVRFDGVDDFLIRGPEFTVNQPNTHYLAVRVNDITSSTVAANAYMFDSVGLNRTAMLYRTSSGQWGMYSGTPGTSEYGGTLVSSSVILTFVSNGASAALYQNGSLIASGNGGDDVVSGFVLGSISTHTNFFSRMDFFEYLMVTGSHDSASRAQVISYLSDKWDISY